MARGQAGAADNQRKLSNTAAAGYGANANSEFNTLMPQAESLVNSKGYDPATLSAITNAGMGGVNAAFGDASSNIKRTAAKTGNPAGIAGQLDAVARDKGVAGGKEAGDIQIQNADFANNQRMAGLNLLNSMYGTGVNAQVGLLGQGPANLQARAAGKSGDELGMSWMKTLLPGIGGAGADA